MDFDLPCLTTAPTPVPTPVPARDDEAGTVRKGQIPEEEGDLFVCVCVCVCVVCVCSFIKSVSAEIVHYPAACETI